MSLETARAFLREKAPDIEITEHNVSTASVAEAASALGVEPGQIAKTLAIKIGEKVVIVVARGDARLDNKKLKAAFGGRPRMLPIDEVAILTGHPVGGVCPFGLATPLPVYCDISLRDFDLVYPAAGSKNSSIRIEPARLADMTQAHWTDLCQQQGETT